MTQPASDRDDGAPTQRKATLFCWECDHTSPVEGDWLLESEDQYVAYVCPDCETTLTKRPRSNEPARERTVAGPVVLWQRAVRTSVTVWRASVDAGFSSLNALIGVRSLASGRSDVRTTNGVTRHSG